MLVSRPLTLLLAVVALVLVACAGGEDEPPIVVSSFNFPESEILAEIYAQALEDDGYPVDRALNLGSRELIYPELLDGGIDLLPEYLGSALMVWFGEEPPADVATGLASLREAFDAAGISVLTPAPAENNQAFVVTAATAETHGLTSIADLSSLGAIRFAGPPECEGRATCFQGLRDQYGLDEITFVAIQEAAARLAALDAAEVELVLLFSTDAPLAGSDYVVLTDTAAMLPPENITPVLRDRIVDVHGEGVRTVLESVTADITTEVLQEMNAAASAGVAPGQIARDWLDAR
jgi:osmoprotectant transport system substrate-binding protein